MIYLQQSVVKLGPEFEFTTDSLSIQKHRHTVIVGPNGSGKSALGAVLAGDGELVAGKRDIQCRVGWVSVAQQQRLLAKERAKDSADILDVIPQPSSVRDIILADLGELDQAQQQWLLQLGDMFDVTRLFERDFIALSTGETRKILLIQQIMANPEVLILDDPWDGLDVRASAALVDLLKSLADKITLVLIINRLSEVPEFCRHWVVMGQCHIVWQNSQGDITDEDKAYVRQLLHIQQKDLTLPPPDTQTTSSELDADSPLVSLTQGHVEYDGNVIFSGLNLQVMPRQHWQITGPNGSGKTCLLQLITGDNPHCYTNELSVFGFRRGSGESIWDIKKHIGMLSNSLHLSYRVNCSLLHVILSGFYDSIGLYQTPTDKQYRLARQWLQLIALDSLAEQPFQSLSFGDQRMALIARAMVKHPTLLILDEPCNGLDDINRLKILALVELLTQQGSTTLLYVNHHAEDVISGIEHHLDMRDYQVK
jgi:molybdate transport system ATP-binding protein